MRAAFLIVLAVFVITVLSLMFGEPDGEQDLAKSPSPAAAELPVYQRVCQQCHGAQGEGNPALKTPSIAGQPSWYLEEQLRKFRLGWRGEEPRDVLGRQMRAIALSLSEPDVKGAVEAVVALPRRETEPSFEGDLANGRLVYEEQCIDCHRYNGSGEKVFGSSPLTAFQDWYIMAQLEKFRQGIRGYHEADEKGAQMRHLISYLSEDDIIDVSAYIATLAERYPPRERR